VSWTIITITVIPIPNQILRFYRRSTSALANSQVAPHPAHSLLRKFSWEFPLLLKLLKPLLRQLPFFKTGAETRPQKRCRGQDRGTSGAQRRKGYNSSRFTIFGGYSSAHASCSTTLVSQWFPFNWVSFLGIFFSSITTSADIFLRSYNHGRHCSVLVLQLEHM